MSGNFVSPNVLWVAAATFGALATGTLVRLAMLRGTAQEVARPRIDSLKTWWGVALAVFAAAVLGHTATTLLFAVISVMSMREFLRLAPALTADWRLSCISHALILLSYFFIWIGWSEVFIAFLPLASLMLASIHSVTTGRTEGFVRQVGGVTFGLLLNGYLLAHVVLLWDLPATSNPIAGSSGWFLFLLLLTEENDIVQALIGRRIGRWRITPRVSPKKSWEGFLGGFVTTTVVAALLGPWLTPLRYYDGALAGALISVAGFSGDVNISAIKRDAGVKDSSHLLPGQGGMLDRVDSLTFSAPVFYYFVLSVA